MTKLVLSTAIAIVMLSGVASAQVYPAPPRPVPPVPLPPAALAPPPVVDPGPSTTTTIVTPKPESGYHESTVTKGIDENGSTVTKKDTYREGVAGGSETHTTVKTDPFSGTVTKRSTTTTSPK